ncbi:phage baseplate assembly protein V [Vibrio sp. HN007]|uniref:phage baseplate assembly protein V n=1 Tax=Vibrio iocasae TaxID=3098914 RepID=UPI0035D4423A
MRREQQQRLMARIKNITGTGTVTGATTGRLQIKTALGRTNDRIDRLHNYGFMSRPLVGAKTYNLFIGGVTARGFTVSVEDKRHQIELEPGEVAVLDDKGNLIHFTRDAIKINSSAKIEVIAAGDINVTAPKVSVTAESTEFSGDVAIGGNLDVAGNVGGSSGKFGGVTVETHDHDYTDDNQTRTTKEPNK